MKLVFYSRLDTAEPRLHARTMDLIGISKPRVGYLAAEPDPERRYFAPVNEHYQSRGSSACRYVDCHCDGRSWKLLFSCDAIHLSGGNTFKFLQWLRQRDALTQLRQYVRAGGVLIGVSAGAMLLTTRITIAERCGDHRPEGFTDDRALALVDFEFLPHCRIPQGTPGPPASSEHGASFGCPDDAGIVVSGNQLEFYGEVARLAWP